jgi:branched-chain amino acid transport system permease protein
MSVGEHSGPSTALPEVGHEPASVPQRRASSRLRRLAPLIGPLALIAALVILSRLLAVSNLLTLEDAVGLAVFAVATNLLLGYGGLVSFGQAAFYGAGAYTVGLGWLHYGLPFWATALLSPAVGAVLAFGVGLIALRTRRLYFALLTLAFSQLFYVIVEEQYHYTQGANGIFGAFLPHALTDPKAGFLFVLSVATVSLLILWKIVKSPFGLILRGIRDNRDRMEALGINVFRHQLLAFVISGAFCSVAGMLFTVYSQSAYPELFNWIQSGYAVFMVVIGGMFSFLGPALGAGVYQFGHDFIVAHFADWQLVLGAVLLVIVLFRPDGLVGLFSPRTWRRLGAWLGPRVRR